MSEIELTPAERSCLLGDGAPGEQSPGVESTKAEHRPPPQPAATPPSTDLSKSSDTGPLDTGPLDTGPLDAGPLGTGPLGTGPLGTGPVDAEIMSAVSAVLQDFAIRLASELTERLRGDVNVTIHTIEQPSYGEFVFGLDHPTCVQVIEADGIAAPLLLELNPGFLFPLLDRLLGGGKLPPTIVRRPLTELEQRLVRKITEPILEQLAAAWSPVVKTRLSLHRMESNPKLVRCARPGEPMLAAELWVQFGKSQGVLRLAMPQASLWELQEELLNPKSAPIVDPYRIQRGVSVVIAESTIKYDDLMELRVGDIVMTETDDGASGHRVRGRRRPIPWPSRHPRWQKGGQD